MKEAIQIVKQNWNDFINALSNLWENIKTLFRKKGISEPRKPIDMYEFIEQKKNRKPFYKDNRSKMWE